MKNTKRGGARKGAGRKPIKDKVIPLSFLWVKKSSIKLLGGKEKFKMKMYNYIDHEMSLAVSPL